MSWADNSVIAWRNLSSSYHKPDLQINNVMYQVWWKSIEIFSLLSWNENTDVSRAGNSVTNWRKLPINKPKVELHNVNAHTKFHENPLLFTKVIVQKRKYGRVAGK